MKNYKNINTSLIRSGKALTTDIVAEKNLSIDRVASGEFLLPWVQGGCSDGKHLYEFMISKDSRHCVIVKYDLATQKVIAFSEDLMLGHANDGAYNPFDHTIAITHCCDLVSPTSNIVYIVDADSLTLVKTYTLPKFDLYEITYNENTRQYITTSEEEMHYWDEDFNLLDVKPIAITPNWPSQGIDCDGEYVYRLECYIRKNEKGVTVEMLNNIRVNDVTTGEEVAIIPLNMGLESENLFHYNGKLYVSCNNRSWTGCEVFRFDFVEKK